MTSLWWLTLYAVGAVVTANVMWLRADWKYRNQSWSEKPDLGTAFLSGLFWPLMAPMALLIYGFPILLEVLVWPARHMAKRRKGR